VPEGILDQRLQQQVGDGRVFQTRRDVPAHLQPVTEAGLLDLQVQSQEAELALEGGLLAAR
jgi:hypothetical protein